MSSKDGCDAPSQAQDASTSSLDDLLARVEAATGQDSTIDVDVMSLAYKRDRRHIGCTCWAECCPGARHIDEVWVDPLTDRWVLQGHAYWFTSSIEAVIALAKRLGFYINTQPRFHIDGERVDFVSYALRPRWTDWRPDDEWFDCGEGRHADQTLSALAALLRALQQKAQDHA